MQILILIISNSALFNVSLLFLNVPIFSNMLFVSRASNTPVLRRKQHARVLELEDFCFLPLWRSRFDVGTPATFLFSSELSRIPERKIKLIIYNTYSTFQTGDLFPPRRKPDNSGHNFRRKRYFFSPVYGG